MHQSVNAAAFARSSQQLTLSPLATAVRHLTLDDFEDVELQYWVGDFQDTLKNRLQNGSDRSRTGISI